MMKPCLLHDVVACADRLCLVADHHEREDRNGVLVVVRPDRLWWWLQLRREWVCGNHCWHHQGWYDAWCCRCAAWRDQIGRPEGCSDCRRAA